MKTVSVMTATFLCVSFGTSVCGETITFDFNGAVDNFDGTVSNIGGWGAGDGSAGLSVSNTVDGTPGIAVEIGESDGFVNLFSNFNGAAEGSSSTPFNQLFEGGGTLTGQAVFTNLGGLIDGTTDPAIAGPQIYMARSGSVTGFDLTDSDDNDDNFNFTGDQSLNVPFNFSFTLPTITGTNGLDVSGFYGVILGASDTGPGGVVVFDNLVFTAIPEPGVAALACLGLATMTVRRSKAGRQE